MTGFHRIFLLDNKKTPSLTQLETKYIRGSTLLKKLFAPSLDARNVCHTYLTTKNPFARSTPECTSYILSLGLLSTGDIPSLSVPNILLFSFFVFTYICILVYSKYSVLSTVKPLRLEKL